MSRDALGGGYWKTPTTTTTSSSSSSSFSTSTTSQVADCHSSPTTVSNVSFQGEHFNPDDDAVGLLDLPWEDILYCYVLPRLSLKELFYLRRTSNKCLRLVTDYFTVCRSVDLTGPAMNNRITETAFQIITNSCTLLTTLILPNCKWLTDSLLVPVLDMNPGLIVADFTSCTGITGNSMQILANRCHQLQKLILRDCYWVTAVTLTVLAIECSNLRMIDLTSCWQINDESICTLVERCPKLKYISLAKIYGVTNLSLVAVACNCRSLRYLDLVGCWRVSDEGVIKIAEYCRDLKTLKIRDCRDISEASLGALRGHVNIDLPLVPYPYNRAIFLRELGLNVQI